MKVLVVGATGQLGTAVVHELQTSGHAVRAFVRPGSRFAHLESAGAELAFGDLRDTASMDAAVRGADAVITTASVVFPRGRASFADDEGLGYARLIAACETGGVGQVIFVSNHAPYVEPYLERVPTLRYKLSIEHALEDSPVPHTIFRSAPFMDDYFALIGSEIPLRGAQNATLQRPFWFSERYVRAVSGLVERWGIASVPGGIHARNSFIALEDVARFLTASVGHPAALNARHVIGGPDDLSWQDVAELYAGLLGRPVRALPSSPAMNRAGSALLRPFSAAAANQLGLLWVLAENEILVDDAAATAALFEVSLTSAVDFLQEKIALPPAGRRRRARPGAPRPARVA